MTDLCTYACGVHLTLTMYLLGTALPVTVHATQQHAVPHLCQTERAHVRECALGVDRPVRGAQRRRLAQSAALAPHLRAILRAARAAPSPAAPAGARGRRRCRRVSVLGVHMPVARVDAAELKAPRHLAAPKDPRAHPCLPTQEHRITHPEFSLGMAWQRTQYHDALSQCFGGLRAHCGRAWPSAPPMARRRPAARAAGARTVQTRRRAAPRPPAGHPGPRPAPRTAPGARSAPCMAGTAPTGHRLGQQGNWRWSHRSGRVVQR